MTPEEDFFELTYYEFADGLCVIIANYKGFTKELCRFYKTATP